MARYWQVCLHDVNGPLYGEMQHALDKARDILERRPDEAVTIQAVKLSKKEYAKLPECDVF